MMSKPRRQSGCRLKSVLVVAVFTLLSVAAVPVAHAPPMVGLPAATPSFIQVNTETTVTVTSRIDDASLIRDSVLLQQVDATGRVLKILGTMNDDEKGGDLKANDKVFTIQVPLNIANPVLLRVSAGFRGLLKRVTCGNVPVSPVEEFVSDFTPEGIRDFLTRHREAFGAAASPAAELLKRLRAEDFKRDWIMMTDSDSSQTGTAQMPRILVPHRDSSKIFGFALDSDKVEYIQFDGKRFRFHAIDAKNLAVTIDDTGCSSCHSGPRPGKMWPYPRPNWDAYDSWAGALPFNRDRIYEGSVEEKSVKRLLKDLRNDPIVGQLDLPQGITRDCNGDVTIAFDRDDAGTGKVDVPYKEDADGTVTFPGDTAKIEVTQGGRYLRMSTTAPRTDPDEGRAVALFDQLTPLNATRVAQELLDKPTDVVDIRPVALAIARADCAVDETKLGDYAPDAALKAFMAFHGMGFGGLLKDTQARQESLPKKKADYESRNLGGKLGLIAAAGGTPDAASITKQVFRRSLQAFNPDKLTGLPDKPTGFMVDREVYGDNTLKIALFRFFLEPSKEPVDKWSMSINGASLDHSITYTFGDLFSAIANPHYIKAIVETLGEAELAKPDGTDKAKGKDKTCAQLAAASKAWFDKAVTDNPDFFKKP